MDWYFRDISDDPSEKELTQQDQFNNDEVALAETLVRETIQNSTDAQASPTAPVRVRFAIVFPEKETDRQILRRIIAGLTPHLAACGMPRPSASDPPRLLIVEDFGTTGLTGSVEEKDNGQFSGFWRRFGRSNKEGTKGGRWGLGKLVFSSASSVRTVIGLTRRNGEERDWVMGQALLRNHAIAGSEKDSVGFWCRAHSSRKGLPTDDANLCALLRDATGLARRSEPGLSLVIPYLLPDIRKEHLLAATIRNYYFPILTGRLSVTVDDTEIDAQTFDAVAASLPGDAVSQSALEFVRHLKNCRDDEPHVIIPPEWQGTKITGELLGVNVATDLRDRFKSGEMLLIRVPFLLKNNNGDEYKTHVDLFLKSIRPGEKAQTLVVRGAITVPTEGKRANLLDCHAALVATDEPISQLLGDAENPAHTQWNERAEKLRAGWQRGGTVLRRVRAALPELHELIVERIEREDPFALLEFFSIPKADRSSTTPKTSVGRPPILPVTSPKAFRIDKRANGFAVLPAPGIETAELPLKIRVRCAYDVLSGNPFKRFSEFDFSFLGADLSIEKKNAHCWPNAPNEIDVQVESTNFSIEVVGFDPNRDLIIEAQS
jgi:hypothetical protein